MKKDFTKKEDRITKLKKTIKELKSMKGYKDLIKKYEKQLEDLENE